MRKQLAASESDEQREILPCGSLRVRPHRSLGECRVREAQRARVPAQTAQTAEHFGIGAAQEQDREQRVLLRSGQIDLIERGPPPARIALSG